MKILYITSKPIFPTIDGGSVAMEKFLSSLVIAGFDVKHLIIETKKHKFNRSAYPVDLYSKTNPEHITVNTRVTVTGALAHLFKNGSYNVSRFHDDKMQSLILESLKKEEYQAVIFDSLFTTSYIKAVKASFNGKLYIRTHNVEFDLWKGYANDAKGLKRLYLNRLAKDIQDYEINTLGSTDGVLIS